MSNGDASGFEIGVGEGEGFAGAAAGGEARNGCGGGVEVGEHVGEYETEEEVLIGGGEVGDAGGAHGVGADEAEGRVGEDVVEGDEARHGGG